MARLRGCKAFLWQQECSKAVHIAKRFATKKSRASKSPYVRLRAGHGIFFGRRDCNVTCFMHTGECVCRLIGLFEFARKQVLGALVSTMCHGDRYVVGMALPNLLRHDSLRFPQCSVISRVPSCQRRANV